MFSILQVSQQRNNGDTVDPSTCYVGKRYKRVNGIYKLIKNYFFI